MVRRPAERPAKAVGSPAQAWARALQLTTPISQHPERIFPTVIAERAAELGGALALVSDHESLTYAELAERSNQYARWALDQGIAKGEAVGLLMPNRPEYLAIWLGITNVGGVVALLNTNLSGRSLGHAIRIAAPKILIVAAELVDLLGTALPDLPLAPVIWVHGAADARFARLETHIEQYSGRALADGERRLVTIDDRALYIYTSGTTGYPKAANVSHGRLMQSSHWFCGMMGAHPSDRIYNCLPMYHSVGGVQVPGAVLTAGGCVVIREKFSARNFWRDVVQSDCTLIQYIGELCRYLLHTPPGSYDTAHRVRMACGNGLAPSVWQAFQSRFRVPHIFEFYGSTEGNVTLFNIEGEPGAVGRIPSYLAHRFPATLVKLDPERGMPQRNENGFCTRCAPNEAGEAIGVVGEDPANLGTRFDGYTLKEESEKKILRDVFRPGDAWFRTGDLMRKDERGYFYFVDRIGDTFRWKGENVSTCEVSEAICAFPGIRDANVYGVAVPGAEGRAGMAALVTEGGLDLRALRAHLANSLPHYARPVFLRIRAEVEVTATFKYTKADLVRQGYDPAATSEALYFDDPEEQAFVRLDAALYAELQAKSFQRRRSRPMD